jgi:hypothetical protein
MNQSPSDTLNGLEDTQCTIILLIKAIHRNLRFYSPNLDPRLFDDGEVLEAIRAKVIERPRTRFYLILPPAGDWRRACPHLLQLIERLSSALEARTLPPEEPRERPEFGQSFFIADDAKLVFLADPRRFIGSYEPYSSAKSKELLNFFQEIWEKSQPDLELRRLRL